MELKERDTEVKISSQVLQKALLVKSNYCWPCDQPAVVFPWCHLVPEGDPPPHSTPYMQMHESRGEGIDAICSKYNGKADLQVVLVISGESESCQKILSAGHLKDDLSSFLVIVSSKYKREILKFFDKARDNKATVTIFFNKRYEFARAFFPKIPESHEQLFKAAQYVIENKLIVSFSPYLDISKLMDKSSTKNMPAQSIESNNPRERLLSFFLNTIFYQHMEAYIELTSSFNAVEVVRLFQNSLHFKSTFSQDFIFYFCLAYMIYKNGTGFDFSNKAIIVTIEFIQCLLQVPVVSVNEQLQKFVKHDDFEATIAKINSIFEYAADSILHSCDIYFETVKGSELIHVSLLLISIALKLLYTNEKLAKKAENIWTKKFKKYFSSGLSIEDITYLDKGLEAMAVILSGQPQLMATWKDFSVIFLAKPYSFEIMRSFIVLGINRLIRGQNDVSFRKHFLEPLTATCMAASQKKRPHFCTGSIIEEGNNFLKDLTQLIIQYKWDIEDYNNILEDWMKIVFNMIDLTDQETRNQLLDWINEKEKKLWINWESSYYEQIENLLIIQCNEVPLEYFIRIINTLKDEKLNKLNVINVYLGRLDPKLLSEKPENDFISLAMTHVSQSKVLITYFRTVIHMYSKDKKILKFFEDLMSLDVLPSEEFNQQLMNQLEPLVSNSSSILQNQFKNEKEKFISIIPHSNNSFNWMITKMLLQVILPKADFSSDYGFISSSFNVMNEEDFYSTRTRAILYVIHFVLKSAPLTDFSCFERSSGPLFVLSELFTKMWTVFMRLGGNVRENCTLEAFKMKLIDNEEVANVVDIISSLKCLVSNISKTMETNDITYADIEAILNGYDVYQAIVNVTAGDNELIEITIAQLELYHSSFDKCVKKIEDLLVRKPENFPDLGREHVKSVLSEYDIPFPDELDSLLNGCVKPSSTTINISVYETETIAQPLVVFTYQANPKCSLATVQSAAERLESFIRPLLDSIDFLVFNSLHKSQILEKCIQYYHNATHKSDSPIIKMQILNEAVDKAGSVIEQLMDASGNSLSMKTIVAIFKPEELKSYDLPNEDKELHQFYKLRCGKYSEIAASQSIMTFLELNNVVKRVRSLQNVCINFKLRKCLNDPIMMRLVDASKAAFDGNIKLKKANEEVQFIKKIFNIVNGGLIDHPFFLLISSLENNCQLYDFANERGYGSVEGMDIFLQEYRLVTTDLLFEEFEEDILDKLIAAMELIFPFFDTTCTLVELWGNIAKIGDMKVLKVAISHLLTVNERIEVIKDWFNQANEEAQENNEKKLEAILSSGCCCFDFGTGFHVKITLEFQKHSSEEVQPSTQKPKVLLQKEIESLSQELGFVNYKPESEHGKRLNWFNSYKDLAFKLHDCYSDLQCFGHLEYQNPPTKIFTLFHIDGSASWLELEAEIRRCNDTRKKFISDLGTCRKDYLLLSFINTQKLKVIHDSLIKLTDIDNLLRNVGFFFKLDLDCYSHLFECVQDLHTFVESNEEMKSLHPAKLTGEFLKELISLKSVQPYLLDFLNPLDSPLISQKHGPVKDHVTFTLISAHNATPIDIFRLVYWTFENSFPMFHQLFRCSPRTTKEEIKLFFDRVLHYQAIDRYLVLGVNIIRNDLQQIFLEKCATLKTTVSNQCKCPDNEIKICLVEYCPSLFQHIPWISQNSITKIKDLPEFNSMVTEFQKHNKGKAFETFEVVYGLPGSGKTHYIRSRIKEHRKNITERIVGADLAKYIRSLSINETFNKTKLVKRFQDDALNSSDVLMHLNINLVWSKSDDYKALFNELVEDINWFFFDYFILRYVEVMEYKSSDGTPCTSPKSLSLVIPTGVSTSVYVEAPYWNIPLTETERRDSNMESSMVSNGISFSEIFTASFSNESLNRSKSKFEEIFPVFALLGKVVEPPPLYDVSSSGVQLVCKYLKGHDDETEERLDHLMKLTDNKVVKIDEIIKDVDPEESRLLLKKHIESALPSDSNNMMKTICLKYLERRCLFMEKSVFFQQNLGIPYPVISKDGKTIGNYKTAELRSNVFALMLQEVTNFCNPSMSWYSESYHKQLLYDVGGGGGTFKLLCTNPEKMPDRDLQLLKNIGIVIPSSKERLSTQILYDYLSFALNVKKDENGEIGLIRQKKFVLTRDFVFKMLNIHERKECGMPLVIKGETGVGKTFLLELLSALWNHSWSEQLTVQRNRIKGFFVEKIVALQEVVKTSNTDLEEVLSLMKETANDNIEEAINIKSAQEMIRRILILKDPKKSNSCLFTVLRDHFQVILYDPVIASLQVPVELNTNEQEFNELLTLALTNCDENIMAIVVCGILYGRLRGTFYKKSIHAAMTAAEIESFFRDVQRHAGSLKAHYNKYVKNAPRSSLYQKPVLTVFLDEINTSSCPGFMKEIIIDGTIDGRSISSDGEIFIVAACNPHRADSLAAVTLTSAKDSKNWFNPTYNVQNLPPTLKLIMWDYEQLKEADEREYIKEKFHLEYPEVDQIQYTFFAEQIAKAQNLIRLFASENLKHDGMSDDDAVLFAQSTVSQRDIQRVFKLYSWLKKWFMRDTKYKNESEFQVSVRAVFVSLALVYYFRLSSDGAEKKRSESISKEKGGFRKCFREKMHEDRKVGECGVPITFDKALADELAWVTENIALPKGIAPTEALKENIYAIIVCVMTKTPVIIVGPPGSSKTISFKIVASKFIGTKSSKESTEDSDLFKSIFPQYYQCSRKSTSHEIEIVFQRAIVRQKTFNEKGSDNLSVVLMDEAGIPEYRHESLKVLHYFLDDPLVSFVGLSNTVLDAAKTNRAISVYRTEASHDDLLQLAKYSFCHGKPNGSIDDKIEIIEGFINIYEQMMSIPDFSSFFGLRDFIHFFTYLSSDQQISPESVVKALEQNFSGTEHFDEILCAFLENIGSKPNKVQRRSLVDILRSSFVQEPQDLLSENKMRYKLLIDSSEDQSLIRLLFTFGILKRNKTKILSCSKLPGDSDAQKLYTSTAIRHSVTQGHTVLIYQAEEIQECFYDLFNQNFTCIKNTLNNEEMVFHCNVAIGSVMKPTRVSPCFNCAMVISQSEVQHTERPFLNRFEKFSLSHKVLLKEALSIHCQNIRILFDIVTKDIIEFVQKCSESSFYGFTDQTIDSLLLSLVSYHGFEDSYDTNFSETAIPCCYSKNCQCDTNEGFFIRKVVALFSDIFNISLSLGDCEEFCEVIKHMMLRNDDRIVSYFDAEFDQDKMATSLKKDIEKVSSANLLSIESFPLSLLRKLIVMHLTNQLLHLMTPEALVIHSRRIEPYYKICYLNHQHHFSLPNIVQSQLNLLKDRNVVKKFLCYTRTSPALLELLSAHSSCSFKTEKERKVLEEFFTLDSKLFHTYIITKSTSQEKLNIVLSQFFRHDFQVLLLWGDMNNLSKDTVNHTRLLIEEAERMLQSLKIGKLVFLILHFPSNMFYSHCYPSIFLKGWRHIYMDMIGQTETNTSTNVEEWLRICLLPSQKCWAYTETKSISFIPDKVLTMWIEKWLPMISSTITIQETKGFPGARSAKDCWSQMLFEFKVEKVIRRRFNNYWQKRTMYDLSLQAANYAMTYQSTRTLSSTIEASIQSNFKNFVLYFLSLINQNMAMHTVLLKTEENPKKSDDIGKPFLCMLSSLHLPESLEEIKLGLAILKHQSSSSSDRAVFVPQFCFFPVVFEYIEVLVNKALHLIHAPKPLTLVATEESEIGRKRLGKIKSFDQEQNVVEDKIAELLRQENDTVIKVVLDLLKDESLWSDYFSDAITKRLDRTLGTFSEVYLKQHLSKEADNVPLKLAMLHYHLRVSWLDANSLSLLRILDDCAQNAPDKLSANVKLVEEPDVIEHIIVLLFTCLTNCCTGCTDTCMDSVNKLGSLFYKMMNLFKVESISSFSAPLKNKWIFLSVVFKLNQLMTVDETLVFQCTIDQFILELLRTLSSAINSETVINCTALTDTTVDIAFKQGTVIEMLSMISPPSNEFYAIIEMIFDHYITFYSKEITEDSATSMFKLIGLIVNKLILQEMDETLAKYRYHFSQLLISNDNNDDSSEDTLNPLLLFNINMRTGLFKAIEQEVNITEPLVYVPTYFKYCSKLIDSNSQLLHILCDMYFEVTRQYLQGKCHTFLELISFYEKVSACSNESPMAVAIEKQAIVHVIIKSFAATLLKDENERQVLADCCDRLNQIIIESNVVEINAENVVICGNGLVLLMRLLSACRSEKVLWSMMVTQFQSNLCDYDILHPINKILSQKEYSPDQFTLLLYIKQTIPSRHQLYSRIHDLIQRIIRTSGQRGVDELMAIALKCYSNKNAIEKTNWTFNMSIFISVYETMFLNKYSRRAEVVQQALDEKIGQYVDELFLKFMKWLLDQKDSPDKLQDFFVRNERDKEHVECIMNLATVLFGDEENSCHAWEHLFSVQTIALGFVPGTMVTGTSDSGYLDVVCTSDKTLCFTKRKSLTWYSLIFTQWMNYGLLCLSFAVMPSNVENFIFKQAPDVISKCIERSKELWEMLMTEFNLTHEERKKLVSRGVQNLYQVLNFGRLKIAWECLKETPNEENLSKYECILHDEVFLPAFKAVKNDKKKFSMFGNTLGDQMRELYVFVPELNICPSDLCSGFLLTIFFSKNLYNKKCSFYVLYQFLIKRPALNIGAHLLPCLIDFYNWIHSQASYKVTLEVAKETSARQILTSILQQYFPEQEEKRLNQLDKINEMYERYVETSGTKPVEFSTGISFFDVVSTNDGMDALLNIILHIIDGYNYFFEMVHSHQSTSHFLKYKSVYKISMSEITYDTCSFGTSENCYDVSDIEPILKKYHSFNVGFKLYDLYQFDESILLNTVPQIYHLGNIQDEIVQKFIVHKHLVSKENFSKVFSFSECSTCEDVPRGLFITATYGYNETIKILSNYPSFIKTLTWKEQNELENLFHSLPYDSLLNVCGGLCLVLKVLLEKVVGQKRFEISSLTIRMFCLESNIDLNDVGIALCSSDCITGLSKDQYNHVCETPVSYVKAMSELFHEWVKIGFYDFWHLPYCLKVKLNKEIAEKIESEDEDTIRSTMHQLFSLEQLICKKSTKSYTTKISDVEKDKKLDSYLFSLPIKYYVYLQLALRRRLLKLLEMKQKELHYENMKEQVEKAKVRSHPSPTPTQLRKMASVNEVLPMNASNYGESKASFGNDKANSGSDKAATPDTTTVNNQNAMSASYLTAGGDLLEAASNLSVGDVANLLQRIGLQKSSEVVLENSYDGALLYSHLTSGEELDPEELGMNDKIDELRFRVVFKRVLEGKEPEHPFSSQKLKEFLSNLGQFVKIGQLVEERMIDGEMLLFANNEIFRNLGIKSLSTSRIKRELQNKLKDF
uniref:Uncharacterized protein n=1 Tax=Amphimedon queenslandica TaxID=400682 RepID=A0A1X7VIM8_AMPQE